MREWNTAFELYVIAPYGRCTSEAVIYSAAGQAAEVGSISAGRRRAQSSHRGHSIGDEDRR
jgi:hypothetical protein